jgi:hypothetical protein
MGVNRYATRWRRALAKRAALWRDLDLNLSQRMGNRAPTVRAIRLG